MDHNDVAGHFKVNRTLEVLQKKYQRFEKPLTRSLLCFED
jgi:hypothetical protein